MDRGARILMALGCAFGLYLGACRNAWADGIKMPEKAYLKPPAIPAQRAFIGWRDGTETLVVESTLDGEGQRFGWIMPVPAEPAQVEKGSTGFLDTLQGQLQPEITHKLGEGLDSLRQAALVVAAWALVLALWPGGVRPVPALAALTAAVVFVVGLLAPGLHKTRHASALGAAGVRVKRAGTVGSYDVAVLEADSAEALNGWLDENGFLQFGGQGAEMVDDYISKGWHFVAARLRREGSGLCTPHPLSIAFPSERPVYPMRLTALAESDVHLDLFVAAAGRARTPAAPMDVQFCDVWLYNERASYGSQQAGYLPGFEARTFHAQLGHPVALQELWDGCCLTRLTGVLRPGDMADDVWLEVGKPAPARAHYYSEQGARQTAWLVALWVFSIGLAAGVILLLPRWRRRRERLYGVVTVVVAVSAASCLVGLGVRAALPVVETRTESGQEALHALHLPRSLLHAVSEARPTLKGDTIPALREEVERCFAGSPHVSAGGLRQADGPGDWMLLEDGRGIVLRVFDLSGFPNDIVLRAAGAPAGESGSPDPGRPHE